MYTYTFPPIPSGLILFYALKEPIQYKNLGNNMSSRFLIVTQITTEKLL